MRSLDILAIVALTLFGLVVIWSIFVLPLVKRSAARKQEAKLEKIILSLKPGDKVLLASGIRAFFVKAKGEVVDVKIAENVKIKIDRHAIIGIYH